MVGQNGNLPRLRGQDHSFCLSGKFNPFGRDNFNIHGNKFKMLKSKIKIGELLYIVEIFSKNFNSKIFNFYFSIFNF